MYVGGDNVPKDTKKASDYYKIACNYGYAGECKNWNVLNGYGPEVHMLLSHRGDNITMQKEKIT